MFLARALVCILSHTILTPPASISIRGNMTVARMRAMFETRTEGDYDHLARFGEWDGSTPPTPVALSMAPR